MMMGDGIAPTCTLKNIPLPTPVLTGKTKATATFTATFIFAFQKYLFFRHQKDFESGLHPGCRRFESVIAHRLLSLEIQRFSGFCGL